MEGDAHEAEPRGMTLMDLVVLIAGFSVAFVLPIGLMWMLMRMM